MGYLDGTDVVWWDKVGDSVPRAIPTFAGGRHPAFRTAAGRALLATEPDNYIPEHFPLQLDRTTRDSLQTRDQLSEAVHAARANGLARVHEELFPQLSELAVPVTVRPVATSDGHQTTVAISVFGPSERVRLDTTLPPVLKNCALEILADIAHSPRAPRD